MAFQDAVSLRSNASQVLLHSDQPHPMAHTPESPESTNRHLRTLTSEKANRCREQLEQQVCGRSYCVLVLPASSWPAQALHSVWCRWTKHASAVLEVSSVHNITQDPGTKSDQTGNRHCNGRDRCMCTSHGNSPVAPHRWLSICVEKKVNHRG
jgi:hypothetical protein